MYFTLTKRRRRRRGEKKKTQLNENGRHSALQHDWEGKTSGYHLYQHRQFPEPLSKQLQRTSPSSYWAWQTNNTVLMTRNSSKVQTWMCKNNAEGDQDQGNSCQRSFLHTFNPVIERPHQYPKVRYQITCHYNAWRALCKRQVIDNPDHRHLTICGSAFINKNCRPAVGSRGSWSQSLLTLHTPL